MKLFTRGIKARYTPNWIAACLSQRTFTLILSFGIFLHIYMNFTNKIVSNKTLFATENAQNKFGKTVCLVPSSLFCSLFYSLPLHQVWFSKNKSTTLSSPKDKDRTLAKKHGFLTQVLSPLKCVLQKNKISEVFTSTEYSETVWRWRDTIYVHQNVSINHAYDQTILALLSSALVKGTLPVSLSYTIPRKVF